MRRVALVLVLAAACGKPRDDNAAWCAAARDALSTIASDLDRAERDGHCAAISGAAIAAAVPIAKLPRVDPEHDRTRDASRALSALPSDMAEAVCLDDSAVHRTADKARLRVQSAAAKVDTDCKAVEK